MKYVIFAVTMNEHLLHIPFMRRCFELALRGAGHVAPNPMVGSVLVYNQTIIGEGYHQRYGEAHAEVNCIASVAAHNRELISQSTLYVSLEPCAHYGKTPPCADLIIRHRIPEVVIACTDTFHAVNGLGVEKLQRAGVKVTMNVLEEEARWLNRRFFTYHTLKRPYIVLKWAQTTDGYIGNADGSRLMISNAISQQWVHRWRFEEQAIVAGTHTVLQDNPYLTNRYWGNKQPVRIVLDRQLRIPKHYNVMNNAAPTIIMNATRADQHQHIQWVKTDHWQVQDLLKQWHTMGIGSVLVEGGAALLTSFLSADLWDEMRIITRQKLLFPGTEGVKAPAIPSLAAAASTRLADDQIDLYVHPRQRVYHSTI